MLDYYLVFVCIAGGLKCRKDPITKCILKYLNNRNICRGELSRQKRTFNSSMAVPRPLSSKSTLGSSLCHSTHHRNLSGFPELNDEISWDFQNTGHFHKVFCLLIKCFYLE